MAARPADSFETDRVAKRNDQQRRNDFGVQFSQK